VKDLCYGLYGKTTLPIDPEVQAKALVGYPKGETPITCRPGDVIPPAMEQVKAETAGLAKDIDDQLIVALYNLTGKKFLKIKYGMEPMPEDMKPTTMEDVKREAELIAKAKAGKLVEKPEAPAKPEDARSFDVFVDGTYYLVEVAEKGGTPRVVSSRPAPVAAAKPAPAPVSTPKPEPVKSAPAPMPVISTEGGESITAPMPGMLVKYEKKPGDKVSVGETVLVLEAMKMYNNIPSPVEGIMGDTPLAAGANVSKGDILAVIKPA